MGKSRNTMQRELLYEKSKEFKSFFDAEELFNKTRKFEKNIGIATVYRFLKKLEDKGHIHSYICKRRKIYSFDKRSHCHFKCEKCGRIGHIVIKSVDFLKDSINGSICHFQVDITGICKECKKNLS